MSRRGFAWLDTGTHESLLEASQYIETVQRMQNVQVANLEEIAYRMGYISREDVLALAHTVSNFFQVRHLNILHPLDCFDVL